MASESVIGRRRGSFAPNYSFDDLPNFAPKPCFKGEQPGNPGRQIRLGLNSGRDLLVATALEHSAIDGHQYRYLKADQCCNADVAGRRNIGQKVLFGLWNELQGTPNAQAAEANRPDGRLFATSSVTKPVQARQQKRKIKDQSSFNDTVDRTPRTERDEDIPCNDERCNDEKPVRSCWMPIASGHGVGSEMLVFAEADEFMTILPVKV